MEPRSGKQILALAMDELDAVPEWTWDGRTLPVPIERIADSHFGLMVEEVEDVGVACGLEPGRRLSGAIVPTEHRILVDAHEAAVVPRRRRYTIAHELGHWCLHRDLGVAARCDEHSVDPEGGPRSASGHSLDNWLVTQPDGSVDIEWEANVFGGALLLPPPLVRRELRVRERHGDHSEELAEIFDVSESAVGPRWLHHYAFTR